MQTAELTLVPTAKHLALPEDAGATLSGSANLGLGVLAPDNISLRE